MVEIVINKETIAKIVAEDVKESWWRDVLHCMKVGDNMDQQITLQRSVMLVRSASYMKGSTS